MSLRQRRAGSEGGPQGAPWGPPVEPLEQQEGEGSAEEDIGGRPVKQRHRGPSRFFMLSCYTATLSLLFLACAIGG